MIDGEDHCFCNLEIENGKRFLVSLSVLVSTAVISISGCGNSGNSAKDTYTTYSQNNLEKAVIIGRSSRQDFNLFKENGGLDSPNQNTWKGFSVQKIEVEWDSNGAASSVTMMLAKVGAKLASINAIKAALAPTCLAPWENRGINYFSDSKSLMCVIGEQSASGQVEVDIVKHQPPPPDPLASMYGKWISNTGKTLVDLKAGGVMTVCLGDNHDACKNGTWSVIEPGKTDIKLTLIEGEATIDLSTYRRPEQ